MAYPEDITTRVLVVPEAIEFESGQPMRMQVAVTADRSLVWAENGWQFRRVERTSRGETGTDVAVDLPVTDLNGWKTDAGALIVVGEDEFSHTYTVSIRYFDDTNAERRSLAREVKGVVLPTGDGPVRLDELVSLPSQAGTMVLVPEQWVSQVQSLLTQAEGAASEAADSAATALHAQEALEAVEATNDGIMTAVAQDPESGFRGELNAATGETVSAGITDKSTPIGAAAFTHLAEVRQPRTLLGVLPSGEFGWLASDYNMAPRISVSRDGSVRGTLGLTPEGLLATSSTVLSTGTVYYVNVGSAVTVKGEAWSAGSNTNNGLSASTPVKSIWKALALAQAAAPTGGAVIRVLSNGEYMSTDCIFDGTGTAPLGQIGFDLAMLAVGGTVTDSRRLSTIGTPSLHGTYTNCYLVTAAASNGRLVVDKTSRDERGNYRPYTLVSTAAICNTTPGSFAIGGSGVYVNPFPGVGPITDQNTLCYISNLRTAGAAHFYMGGESTGDGWDLVGGGSTASPGCFAFAPTSQPSTRKLGILSRVRGLYSASSTGNVHGFAATSTWFGTMACFDTSVVSPERDAYNVHSTYGAKSNRMLTVNASAYGAGRLPNASSNSWTTHEETQAVDVAGDFREAHGGAVHTINQTKSYLLGTLSADDYGDIIYGGSIPPTQFKAGDTAKIWLQRALASGDPSAYAYVAASGGGIYLRDPYGTPLLASGPVSTY